MMMSEFIERTGFEPTGEEYKEIEQEYLGTEINKDQFCKEWVKNGGVQRLCRRRARRIEELEAENRKLAEDCSDAEDRLGQQKDGYERLLKAAREAQDALCEQRDAALRKLYKAEVKIGIIQKAIDIFTGKEEV